MTILMSFMMMTMMIILMSFDDDDDDDFAELRCHRSQRCQKCFRSQKCFRCHRSGVWDLPAQKDLGPVLPNCGLLLAVGSRRRQEVYSFCQTTIIFDEPQKII